MEKKTILFDGGPLHNQFREVPIHVREVKYFEHVKPIGKVDPDKLVSEDLVTRYYRETTVKYNDIPVFVWIELKPKENESDNETIEATKV